jgi:hypothetical protein
VYDWLKDADLSLVTDICIRGVGWQEVTRGKLKDQEEAGILFWRDDANNRVTYVEASEVIGIRVRPYAENQPSG